MLTNPPVIPSDMPAAAIAQSADRRSTTFSSLAPTSGRLTMTAIYLRSGQVVNSVTFFSTATALSGGSHGWAALFDPSRNLLAQSANDTGITWAASVSKTFTLAAPVAILTSGWYYVGVSIVATTMPTLASQPTGSSVVSQDAPVMGGWSTASLTSTAPATAGAIAVQNCPYSYVS